MGRVGRVELNRPVVVVKVGGSLLDWPALPHRLSSYIEDRKDVRLVLVVGGGRFADVLRDLDAIHELGEVRSHDLALRALDLTAWILAGLLPGSTVVEAVDRLDDVWSSGLLPILAPRRFLEADDRLPDPLPHAWTTTTDSIAARLAVRIGGVELALLKSTSLPSSCNLQHASKLGLIDVEFPNVAQFVPLVTFRDLHDPTNHTMTLHRAVARGLNETGPPTT